MQLWNAVSSKGYDVFVDWLCRLFSEIKEPKGFKAFPGVKFLDRDTIRTMYEVYIYTHIKDLEDLLVC